MGETSPRDRIACYACKGSEGAAVRSRIDLVRLVPKNRRVDLRTCRSRLTMSLVLSLLCGIFCNAHCVKRTRDPSRKLYPTRFSYFSFLLSFLPFPFGTYYSYLQVYLHHVVDGWMDGWEDDISNCGHATIRYRRYYFTCLPTVSRLPYAERAFLPSGRRGRVAVSAVSSALSVWASGITLCFSFPSGRLKEEGVGGTFFVLYSRRGIPA